MSILPISPSSIEVLPFRPSSHLPLRLNINSTLPHDNLDADTHLSIADTSCLLHLDITLPDALFVDPDEVLHALHGMTWSLDPPSVDIERPVSSDAIPTHLYLAIPPNLDTSHELGVRQRVKVPLHARYLEPSEEGRETVWLFDERRPLRGAWVCRADGEHGLLSEIKTPPVSVMLPTGKTSHQPMVEMGTMVVVWGCFVYLALKMWKTYGRLSERHIGRVGKAKVR